MRDPHDALHDALAGRYELIDVLGEGGMGTVYRARDKNHPREVAIKTLRADLLSDTAVRRFEREISVTARLQHPHIVPLLESGNAHGHRFYVTPLIRGETLRQRLEREGRHVSEAAIRIVSQIAEALDYAHTEGIVHRDIKPENVLMTGDQALIADFGIAWASDTLRSTTLTGENEVVGTVAYLSPEQAGLEAQIDGRADLYSLACVLYELLSGRPPYVGSTPAAILRQHLLGTPPQFSKLGVDVPAPVEAAVLRALAVDRERRYPTAAALIADLRAEGRGEGLGSGSVRPVLHALSSPKALIIVAAMLLIAALLVAGLLSQT